METIYTDQIFDKIKALGHMPDEIDSVYRVSGDTSVVINKIRDHLTEVEELIKTEIEYEELIASDNAKDEMKHDMLVNPHAYLPRGI